MPPKARNGFTQHAAPGAAPCSSRTCAIGRRSNAHSAAPRLNGLASFRGFLPRALSNACPPTWGGSSSPRGRGRRRTKLNISSRMPALRSGNASTKIVAIAVTCSRISTPLQDPAMRTPPPASHTSRPSTRASSPVSSNTACVRRAVRWLSSSTGIMREASRVAGISASTSSASRNGRSSRSGAYSSASAGPSTSGSAYTTASGWNTSKVRHSPKASRAPPSPRLGHEGRGPTSGRRSSRQIHAPPHTSAHTAPRPMLWWIHATAT